MKFPLSSNYVAVISDQDVVLEQMSEYLQKLSKSYGFGDEFQKIKKILALKTKIDKNRADFTKNAQLEKDYVAVTFNNS